MSCASGPTSSLFGILLYILLNTSYSIAVFTDPGSPATSTQHGGGYSHLPITEPSHDHDSVPAITVSSSGAPRYCKKCHCRKPDRAHHCSTCRRCVLKMDHHCPWLATCVGLHNYKAFLLFLIYTCIFCWVCFGATAHWVWSNILSDAQYTETLMPINVVLLAVISGIIGLVLTGFTAWHLSLATRGMTTIECLEKTRYLTPMRQQMAQQQQLQKRNDHSPNGMGERLQRAGRQFLEIHANAVPGATRLEEGEERSSPKANPSAAADCTNGTQSPAQQALYRNYGDMERSRERDRYEDYLDDQESEKLPNAFDLGWRRNLRHLFGERPLYWFLPVCNTTGDGWRWETSMKWREATEQARLSREQRSRTPSYEYDGDLPGSSPHIYSRGDPTHGHRGADRFYDGPAHRGQGEQDGLSMKALRRPKANIDRGEEDGDVDYYEVSSDEEAATERRALRGSQRGPRPNGRNEEWRDWD